MKRAGRPEALADAGSATGGVGRGAACRSAALPARVLPVRPRPLCLILARCRSPPGSRGAARRLGEARRPGSGGGVVSVGAACPARCGGGGRGRREGVEQQVQRAEVAGYDLDVAAGGIGALAAAGSDAIQIMWVGLPAWSRRWRQLAPCSRDAPRLWNRRVAPGVRRGNRGGLSPLVNPRLCRISDLCSGNGSASETCTNPGASGDRQCIDIP